jgi:hypothetical protein
MANKAFVSSTFEDLKEHRKAVIASLRKAGIFVDPMEDWTAATDEPKKFSQDRVKDCDLCVLLVAFRRGHVPEGEELSITELEYQAAVRSGIDILVFMLREDSPWPRKFDELEKDAGIRLFRAKLAECKGVSFFGLDPSSIEIAPAVTRWISEKQKSAVTHLSEGYDAVLKDLLRVRDAFHAHLCRKRNVIGTAVGRYLVRKTDPLENATSPSARWASRTPRTLANSEVRSYSQPCVLVFVNRWDAELSFPTEAIDPALVLPDGRSIPTCIVLAPFEQQTPASPFSYSTGPIGGGYPLIAEYQGVRRLASLGCLVKDETAIYALTSLRTVGRDGQLVSTMIEGRLQVVGKSSVIHAGVFAFSDIYPGLSEARVNVNLDAGLVLLDDVNTATAQILSIGAPGPIAPGAAGISGLELIGAPVTAFGCASGRMTGKINAFFYRYQTEDGSETICDFLIGPTDMPGDSVSAVPLATPGNVGAVWLLESPDGKGMPRPIACTLAGQRVDSGVGSFVLAASLGTVTKLLGVSVVRDWNIGLPIQWASRGVTQQSRKASERKAKSRREPSDQNTSRKRL